MSGAGVKRAIRELVMSRSQLDPLPQAGQASGCVAIIPARGGSRGVPRKNLQAVGGRSLLERSVECALAADAVDSVWVSTDDAEIATLARRCGAEVIMRPEALASATASSESALQHALEALAERAVHPRLLVMLQCTAPFTTAADVDGAIAKLETEDADSCFTAVADHQFLWRQDNGHAVGINHDGRTRVRRQEMPPQFRENGGVYVVRTEAFVREQTRFCGRTVLCVTDAERSIEIDSPADLIQADALAQHLDRGTALEQLPPNPAAVIFDFDGVFTDGGVFVDEHGAESVRCDRSDGLGLSALRQHQIPVLVLSKERNQIGRAHV